MKTLKDKIFIRDNIPKLVLIEMNKSKEFRNNILEKQGLLKYKDMKEAYIKLLNYCRENEKELIKLPASHQIVIGKFIEIFGNFEK